MNAYTMCRCFLAAGLLLVGCGDEASNGTPEIDGGTGGALVGDAGRGGSGGAAAGTGGTMADAGTGGAVMPGTGGAGSGGAVGSGGAQGSGGSAGGAGGTIAGTGGAGGSGAVEMCVDPMGWKIEPQMPCYNTAQRSTKKGAYFCWTNCISKQPNGLPGNYVGPPRGAECATGDSICVASCSECQ